jgi:outer membrane protein assembly factor BamA
VIRRAVIHNIILVSVVLAVGCRGTRRLAEGEVLYTGVNGVKLEKVKVEDENWELNKGGRKVFQTVYDFWETPNGDFMGMPFIRVMPIKLFNYNCFYTTKKKGFRAWMMRNFGEPPKTISGLQLDARTEMIENRLVNMGHFGTKVGYKLKYNRKRNKAKVAYIITLTKAYQIREIGFGADSISNISAELGTDMRTYSRTKQSLKKGDDFDLNEVTNERDALWRYLQNNGYFYLKRNDIEILADTTVGSKQADIRFQVNTSLSANRLSKVKLKGISVQVDTTVTVGSRPMELINESGYRIKPGLVNKLMQIKAGELFSYNKMANSLRNLSSTQLFYQSYVDYRIGPEDSTSLITTVYLKTLDAFSMDLETDVTMKNTGFVGPSFGLKVGQLNLFGKAENLTLKVSGYYDHPYGRFRERISPAFGYSVDATLEAPLLNGQFLKRFTNARSIPRQFFNLGYEENDRLDYFVINNWKMGYGLRWRTNRSISHEWRMLNLNYSNLQQTTPEFDSLLTNSRSLQLSFKDQFIAGSIYTFTYDDTYKKKSLTYRYDATVDVSGNILNGLFDISGRESSDLGRTVLGVPYSQYLRFESNFRAYWHIFNSRNQLVFRNLIGVGKALGNSELMPYIKQFYIGGSNSMRPFQARNIGPGRYLEFDQTAINQVGDLKLEMNLEYRFPLGYSLEGAIWTDVGNIWLFEDDPDRPFTGINFRRILPDSYMTNGIGLRLDLNFLLIRADYGVVTYAPVFIDGFKWIWQNGLPLHGPVFSFGYPF